MAYAQNMETLGSLCSLPVNLIYQSFNAGRQEHSIEAAKIVKGILSNKAEYFRDMTEVSERVLSALIELGGSYVSPGLDALSSNILMAGWTAFESLSADLWVEAVNVAPELADKVIDEGGKRLPPDAPLDKQPERTIKLSTIKEFRYELGGHMGEILRREKKVYLDSYDGVRRAYRAAFGEAADRLFESFGDLPVIENIRHLLAHRAGVIDARFAERVDEKAGLGKIEIGTKIKLGINQVMMYVFALKACSESLLEFVDRRIQSDGESNGKNRQDS